MEPDGLLPCLQEASTDLYPESDDPRAHTSCIVQMHSNIILPSTCMSSKWSSFPVSRRKLLISSVYVTCYHTFIEGAEENHGY